MDVWGKFRIITVFLILSMLVFAVEDPKKGLDSKEKNSLVLNSNIEGSFSIISKLSSINIFVDSNVPKGKPVYMQIDGMTIKEILDILLRLNGLRMERVSDNSIIVFPQEQSAQYSGTTKTFYLKNADAKEIGNLIMVSYGNGRVYINAAQNSITVNAAYTDMEAIREIIEESDKDELYIEKTIFLSYLKPEDAQDMLTKLKQKTKFSINKSLNSITFTVRSDEEESIEKMIKKIDIRPSQAIIEIVLLDASSSFIRELGLSWDESITVNPDRIGDTKLKTILMPNSFSASEVRSNANILSNPTIRVLNNEAAKINIGERIPIVIAKPTGAQGTNSSITAAPSVEYKDVGIQMEVTPTVHMDNEVSIKLNLEVSSLGEKMLYKDYGDYPIFVTKNISTIIRLKDGETAIFGGLISNEERNKKVTLPFIGEIPLIGNLFAQHEKTPKKSEIVMMITPHIINIYNDEKNLDDVGTKLERTEKTNKIIEKINKKEVGKK